MYFNYTFDCPNCNYRTEYPSSPPPFGGNPQYNQSQSQMPSGPPPKMVPSKNQGGAKSLTGISPMAIDSGAIVPCKYRYVYIWLTSGSSFWAWLTFVGRRSVSGYRWTGRRWVYFGTDLRRIESFICR